MKQRKQSTSLWKPWGTFCRHSGCHLKGTHIVTTCDYVKKISALHSQWDIKKTWLQKEQKPGMNMICKVNRLGCTGKWLWFYNNKWKFEIHIQSNKSKEDNTENQSWRAASKSEKFSSSLEPRSANYNLKVKSGLPAVFLISCELKMVFTDKHLESINDKELWTPMKQKLLSPPQNYIVFLRSILPKKHPPPKKNKALLNYYYILNFINKNFIEICFPVLYK